MADRTILAIDVGGSHVKVLLSANRTEPRRLVSGPDLGPREMVERVAGLTSDWKYDKVSIGIPAPVRADRVVAEPVDLGSGWVGFAFQAAFGKPTKVVNDAAMQAAATVVAFLARALSFYDSHGITAKRLMSDNAWTYTHSHAFRQQLQRRGIRHLLIQKGRPQTNGKVERYQQTLRREWALSQVYRSSDHRASALTHWLNHYNHHRPHSALGGQPPISRVHNLPRQNIW